jgi:hypothetical protein
MGTECSKCTLEMAKEQINAQYQDKDNMTCLDIGLVSDLRLVGGFLRVLRFPPSI